MAEDSKTLDVLRARIDAIDDGLLQLLEERAALPAAIAQVKGRETAFGLRPGRETEIIRRLLASPRTNATPTLILSVWRELMGHSLARQGPFELTVWGGRDPARAVELARLRFGSGPPLRTLDKPEAALAAARQPGGVAVLPLSADSAWWGRLLAEPRLKVFAALPCLAAWGPMGAFAVADVEVEPTGADNTFWVTDAAGPASAVEDQLSRDGVAAERLVEASGLKLFALAGFYQPDDERLARAPGSLCGVIGAAPAPFDV